MTAWLRRIIGRLRSRPSIDVAFTTIERFVDHNGTVLAGHLAFSAMLAIFPFLIFLAALAGFLVDSEGANELIDLMFLFMPEDVAGTLEPVVRSVIEAQRGGLLTFGILVTLWVASGGLEALRIGLNKAYDVAEPRPLWKRRVQSLILVVVFALMLLAASLSVVFGPVIWALVERIVDVGIADRVVFTAIRYGIGAVALFGLVFAVHRFLPNRVISWQLVMPGVMITLFLWLLGSTGLSLYLRTLADYDATYGALGGIVITLLFFYLMAMVFVLGAELNGALAARRHERPREVAAGVGTA